MSEVEGFLSDFMDEKMDEVFRRNRVVDPAKERLIDQEKDLRQSEKTTIEEGSGPDRRDEEML